ncbi:hypothetical protein EV424DRAFT_1536412 [Suillus variegatus]|nr:hypothetical protein EV424DRAFT_1536412 [Suillus variegatus]
MPVDNQDEPAPMRASSRNKENVLLRPTNRSIPELISNPATPSKVIDAATARAELVSKGMLIPAAGATINDLVNALFEFTISTPGVTQLQRDMLRAIAILLGKADHEQKAKKIAETTSFHMTGTIERLEKAVDSHEGKITALDSFINEVRDSIDSAMSRLEKAVENTTSNATESQSTQRVEQNGDPGKSYAKALQARLPKPDSSTLARSEAQTRQILIDRKSMDVTSGLKDLTEAELVRKANQALEGMKATGKEVPQDALFTSARKLRHGGVIFEVDSTDTKAWLSCQSTSQDFSENFGGETMIKNRTFQIIAEYVPTTFNPDSSTSLAETEKNSKLQPGSLIKAKWIKPLARRNPNQRSAFCTLSCKDRESANHAIRLGLTIEGCKIAVHKLLPEPTRCLKCQQLTSDHMAATCSQETDTCGTCGLDHRTSECDFGTADPQHHYCINCGLQGHASWSRDCPCFIERSNKMHGKSEEARYKFFPTEDDPESWEIIGEANPRPTQQQPFTHWTQSATHEAEYGRARNQPNNQNWTRVEHNKGKSRSQPQTRTRDQGWPNQ